MNSREIIAKTYYERRSSEVSAPTPWNDLRSGLRQSYFSFADALLAALEAAGFVIEQGWRPIEEAPKDGDGTDVLIWTPEGLDISSYSPEEPDGQQSMGHDAGWWGLYTGADPGRHMGNPDSFREPECQPSDFRPLPAPPKERQGE